MASEILFYFLTLNLLFSTTVYCNGDFCHVKTPCSCQFGDNSVISLEGLFPTTTKDKFLNDAYGNYTYFFSGCSDQEFKAEDHGMFSNQVITASLIKCVLNITEIPKAVPCQGSPGDNVTIIVNMTKIFHNCTKLGNSTQIDYDKAADDADALQIVYNDERTNKSFLPSIRLVCNNYKQANLKVASVDSDALILYSPIVCTKHTGESGLSGGSIFLIILFIGLALYLVGGGLILYTIRGARGIEVIPHLDFWRSIPGLVRDGIIYIFSGCRTVSISSAETYDRI